LLSFGFLVVDRCSSCAVFLRPPLLLSTATNHACESVTDDPPPWQSSEELHSKLLLHPLLLIPTTMRDVGEQRLTGVQMVVQLLVPCIAFCIDAITCPAKE
jgi:hypothetical protein